jgi:hypothetical protein
MIRETGSQQFSIVVKTKQKPDGLWVADVRINPKPSPEIRRAVNKDLAFRSRTDAEVHGMRIADELIFRMKS